jgi:hypothetical protein
MCKRERERRLASNQPKDDTDPHFSACGWNCLGALVEEESSRCRELNSAPRKWVKMRYAPIHLTEQFPSAYVLCTLVVEESKLFFFFSKSGACYPEYVHKWSCNFALRSKKESNHKFKNSWTLIWLHCASTALPNWDIYCSDGARDVGNPSGALQQILLLYLGF